MLRGLGVAIIVGASRSERKLTFVEGCSKAICCSCLFSNPGSPKAKGGRGLLRLIARATVLSCTGVWVLP